MAKTVALTPLMGFKDGEWREFLTAAKIPAWLNLPGWVEDRPYLVVDGTEVRFAFYVRERAFAFAYRRGYRLIERRVD